MTLRTLSLVVAACAVAGVAGLPAYCGAPHGSPPLHADQEGKFELQQVQVFIRHGDRTVATNTQCWPDDTAVWNCTARNLIRPTLSDQLSAAPSRLYRMQFDAGRNALPGNCMLGELTSIGMQQHVENGRMLREAYVDRWGFLPANYSDDPSAFYLRSDHSSRVIKSAQSLFDGMYPLEGGTDEEVVPFHTMDENYDDIIPNPGACPALAKLTVPPEMEAVFDAHKKAVTLPLYQKLWAANPIGKSADEYEVGILFDCMYTHICHGFDIPEVLEGPEQLGRQAITEQEWQVNFTMSIPDFIKYGAGPLITQQWKHMTARMAGDTDTPKFFLTAGHDTGPMMPLLHAFGVAPGTWAPYASEILWELWRGPEGGYYFRFVYQGEALQLPGCSAIMCPMAELVPNVIDPLLVSPAECNA